MYEVLVKCHRILDLSIRRNKIVTEAQAHLPSSTGSRCLRGLPLPRFTSPGPGGAGFRTAGAVCDEPASAPMLRWIEFDEEACPP